MVADQPCPCPCPPLPLIPHLPPPTTDKQIGQLGAITPAVTFVVAPLWGALADGTGKHKDVLLFTFVASVVSRLLFIWRVRACSNACLLKCLPAYLPACLPEA